MSFIKIAGYQWSPELVQWGGQGRGKAASLNGYQAKRTDGKRGRLAHDTIKQLTVDVWSVEAVYALFKGESLLYVGEGNLGDCLYRHYRGDEFVGRWDSFSWVSPWDIDVTKSPPTLVKWDAESPVQITGKQLVEHLETILIRLAEPAGNRQNPSASDAIKWLEQSRPEGYKTLDEKVDLIAELGDKIDRILKILENK